MEQLVVTVRQFERRFPNAVDYLRSHGVPVCFCEDFSDLPADRRTALLTDTGALLVAAEHWSAETLALAKRLRILSKMGSGMDNVDLNYCRSAGITVTNSSGCNANAVAEFSLMLILASLRGLSRLCRTAGAGRWQDRFAGEELRGKTVGLVGFGQIARRLAALLAPFGVELIACDPYIDRAAAASLHVAPLSFEEVLTQSDILSLHIPALPENRNLFNQEAFAHMRNGAVFINCARGALVDEDALYGALASGRLSAAACDVYNPEPPIPHNRLFSLDNFIGTPHSGGMSTQSAEDDSMTVAASIVDCLSGREPGHRVV